LGSNKNLGGVLLARNEYPEVRVRNPAHAKPPDSR